MFFFFLLHKACIKTSHKGLDFPSRFNSDPDLEHFMKTSESIPSSCGSVCRLNLEICSTQNQPNRNKIPRCLSALKHQQLHPQISHLQGVTLRHFFFLFSPHMIHKSEWTESLKMSSSGPCCGEAPDILVMFRTTSVHV